MILSRLAGEPGSGKGQAMRVVMLVLLMVMAAGRGAWASDPLTAITEDLPPGVTVDLLVADEIDWPLNPNGGGWAVSMVLARDRLEPGESVPVQSRADAFPGADALVVDHGLLSLSDSTGAVRSFSEGEHFTVSRPDALNAAYRYEFSNAGSQCASVLRLSTSSCYQCGGGGSVNPNAPLGQSRASQSFLCPEPVRLRHYPQTGRGSTVTFLGRVTISPDDEWDLGRQLNEVTLLVERGEMTIDDLTGARVRLGPDESLTLVSNAPHRVRNFSQEPLTFLMFGMLSSNSGSSVLEVHRARCGPGAQPPYFRDCHDNGRAGAMLRLEGPNGYDQTGVTEMGLSETVTSPGPAIAIFRALPAGEFQLRQWAADSGERVFISCSDNTGVESGSGPLLAEHEGPASEGIDLDIPADAYVICEWYTGVS